MTPARHAPTPVLAPVLSPVLSIAVTVLPIVAVVVVTAGSPAAAQTGPDDDGRAARLERAHVSITAGEFLEHVRFLADDDLAGRDTGSDGERKAAEYIVGRLGALGLEPAGVEGTWFQEFDADGVTGRNVIGRLPGADPALADEVVVIGGHYDHVGMGHYGSRGESGRIHNGADDNASGVAAILEVAEAFVEAEVRPARSVLFILFSGEERGLHGSTHFVAEPTLERSAIVAMINLDMVGRARETGRLNVHGTGSSPSFGELVDDVAADLECDVRGLGFGIAPSDNTPFYQAAIPVLFLTTGTHPEYHTPEDDVELVNAEGGAVVARFAFEIVLRIADAEERPVHQVAEMQPGTYLDALRWVGRELAEPETRQELLQQVAERMGIELPGPPARLGVRVSPELVVRRVTAGGAAAGAGIAEGDVLRTAGGVELGSLEDLQAVLERHEPGDELEMTLERDGETVRVTVTLGS